MKYDYIRIMRIIKREFYDAFFYSNIVKRVNAFIIL